MFDLSQMRAGLVKVYGVDTAELARLRDATPVKPTRAHQTRTREIVKALEKNIEMSVDSLAGLMGCSREACHRCLLRLRKNGTVQVRKVPMPAGGYMGMWGLA